MQFIVDEQLTGNWCSKKTSSQEGCMEEYVNEVELTKSINEMPDAVKCQMIQSILQELALEKRMLSVDELGHYTGLAPQTIKNQFYAGRFPIPPKRLGRKLLWDKKMVDRYLDRLKAMDS
jgi:predicted DNA-binding transcriptional regulator AlpA